VQRKIAAVALASLVGCSGLPRLANEDATVIVRCDDGKDSTRLIVVLLDHARSAATEGQRPENMQRIAEIEIDSECHFKVRAPKTPIDTP